MALWGCRVLTRTLGGTLAHDNFHLIAGQSGPVNRRRRVSSAGSDGSKASESVRRSLAHPTWLPWFSPASGACRAPEDALGIRASVSGCEGTNGADDEPCCSRCVWNNGGFIGWRAAYLRTSAHPKAPPTHVCSRSRNSIPDSFWLTTAGREFPAIKTKNTDKIGSTCIRVVLTSTVGARNGPRERPGRTHR